MNEEYASPFNPERVPVHSSFLRLRYAGEEACAPSHRYGGVRDHFLLHYIVAGEGRVRIREGTWTLGAGSGFLFFPGQEHEYRASRERPWQYLWVGFDGSGAETAVKAAGMTAGHPVFRSLVSPELAGFFRAARIELSGNEALSQVAAEAYLALLITRIGRILAKSGSLTGSGRSGPGRTAPGRMLSGTGTRNRSPEFPDDTSPGPALPGTPDEAFAPGCNSLVIQATRDRKNDTDTVADSSATGSKNSLLYVAEARRFMDEHFTRPIGVIHVARRIGIDRGYLTTLFRSVTGLTPSGYLAALRLSRADMLLDSGVLSVSQVATSVGFREASVFSRWYQMHRRLSPSQRRKARVLDSGEPEVCLSPAL